MGTLIPGVDHRGELALLINAGKMRYEAYKQEKKEQEIEISSLRSERDNLRAQLDQMLQGHTVHLSMLEAALADARKENDSLTQMLHQERDLRAAASTINTSTLSSAPPSPVGDLMTPVHMNNERLERELEESRHNIEHLRHQLEEARSFINSLQQIIQQKDGLLQQQQSQLQSNPQSQQQQIELIEGPPTDLQDANQQPAKPGRPPGGPGFQVKGGVRVVHAAPVETHTLTPEEKQYAVLSMAHGRTGTPPPLSGGDDKSTLYSVRLIQGVISFLTGKSWQNGQKKVERVQL